MRRFLLAALLLPSIALAQAAPAPTPQQGSGGDVVIEGRKPDHKMLVKAVHGYVNALWTPPGVTDPIARFDEREPACPGAAGLSPERVAIVVARLRRVASAAHVPLAPAGCKPTALLIVAASKAEVIAGLYEKHPLIFGDAYGTRTAAEHQKGPASAWHVTGRIDRSGMPAGTDPPRQYTTVTTPVTPSRIDATIRPVFVGAVAVVEFAALDGRSLTQLADYAAMRLFVDSDPSRMPAGAETIISLLDTPADAAPPSLTRWDLGYLRAVYAIPAEHYAGSQANEVFHRMIADLDAREAASAAH